MNTNIDRSATPASAGAPSAGDLLATHHHELDTRLDALVARAQGGDTAQLRREWSAFERELLRHMELEEAEVLPAFARADASAARAVLHEHGGIRAELFELGVTLDLHLLRADRVARLVEQLRAHARREEQALYAWARREADEGARDAIARGLRDAQAPRP